MTVTIEADTAGGDVQQQQPHAQPTDNPEVPVARRTIAVCRLSEHPGNVRRDLKLTQEFLSSVSEQGILTSLRIVPDGDGYRVIEGHRRLAAAIELGITEVPYDLAVERTGDEAGQFLDMYSANHHRQGLTALEEADALFSASAAGASRTRIRKASGLDKEQVAAALSAARLRGVARATAEGLGESATLDQLALLAEFEGDEQAVARLTAAFTDGRSGQHIAERIRQERAEADGHEKLVAQLAADGYTIGDGRPENAFMLYNLLHDGQELTEEAHAACPGRGVFFYPGALLTPRHYCTDPKANGHTARYNSVPLPDLSGEAGAGEGGGAQGPAPDEAEARSALRRLVVEGNKAFAAARSVRLRWLTDVLLARRTTPKDAVPFVVSQFLTMPGVLRDAVAAAPKGELFAKLTGGNMTPDAVGAWPAARLPMVLLAVVVTAYEDRLDGDGGRMTWRTDQRAFRCDRAEAGAYLRFLAGLGYELSFIEQAIADGRPYTGDQPDSDPPADAPGDASGSPANGGDDTDDTHGADVTGAAAGDTPAETGEPTAA